MTLTEHASATLQRQAGRLEEQIALALQDPAEDPVHDFRVAIRRLSQTLRLFAGLFPDKQARQMRRALKPALSAAATVRDLDVDSDLLVKLELPADHALLSKMHADRQRAALALTGHLYLLRSQEIPLGWAQCFTTLRETGEDAALAARALLPPLAAEFFKAGRKTALKGSAERFHAFRLAAKRFRYTLEVFRPFYGPVYEKRLEQVREIQSLLGKRQDCAVTAALLRPLASIDPAIGTVLSHVEHRGASLENEFLEFWHHQFDAAGEVLLWQRYLSRRPPTSNHERTNPTQVHRSRQRHPEERRGASGN